MQKDLPVNYHTAWFNKRLRASYSTFFANITKPSWIQSLNGGYTVSRRLMKAALNLRRGWMIYVKRCNADGSAQSLSCFIICFAKLRFILGSRSQLGSIPGRYQLDSSSDRVRDATHRGSMNTYGNAACSMCHSQRLIQNGVATQW